MCNCLPASGKSLAIDFDKFFNKEEDYSRETPETGLSGKGTKERMKVDEKTEELEFWKED